MSWLLPLGATSAIPGFDSKHIPSQDHYQVTTDTYSELWPWRSYRSSTHMPPHMEITRHNGELSNGYIFMTPYDDKMKDGVHEEGVGFMMTQDGDLVFTPEEHGYNFCHDWLSGMTDFRKQEYKGRPYLTYWNGCNTQGAHWGHRWGRVTFIDEDYSNFTINPDLGMTTLDNANQGQIDVHEHEITERNTMVVTSYNNTQHDLTSIGGPTDPDKSWVADSCFFEVDIETEEVLFSWCALDHVPLENARLMANNPRGNKHDPWDWFHINSVQAIGENYMISSRHHFTVYLISGKDGSIIWNFDGQDQRGDFGSMPANFMLQHHARAQNFSDHGMTITLFNNHGQKPSQGLGFWVPLPPNPNNPPQLVKKLEVPKSPVHAATQGSVQLNLGNGNSFVGYGKIPLAREFGPTTNGEVNGDLLWQARFGHDGAAMSYRAFKMPWRGTPKGWDPVVFVEKVRLQRDRYTKVFVSWNGATDVNSWAVFKGDDKDSLKSAGVAKKQGFETVFHLEKARCVQLGAIRDGEVIRGSNVVCVEDDEEDEEIILDSNLEHETDSAAINEIEADKDQLASEKQRLEALNADLEAEKEALQTANDDMEAKIDEMGAEIEDYESGAWFSYRLFAEVACAVVLVVTGSWAYILWRDRRQRHYQSIDNEASYFDLRRVESETGSTRGVNGSTKDGGSPDDFELEDDDEDNEKEGRKLNARIPFLRSITPG
ncbi:hypothetical protein LTR37_007217 [Vermiconidia calcicola]|uniref:Uncharacterized protein n=1 Tax=Vermiconidia calcicola TaxID=1690605 RepID=A0ACC3NF54_9PEZI|nr:hypothetical protein LTR37_007217 [Vermiconidia calcicola]